MLFQTLIIYIISKRDPIGSFLWYYNQNEEVKSMEKKPIVMVVKDANDAAKKLNELVEKGYYSIDFGIS